MNKLKKIEIEFVQSINWPKEVVLSWDSPINVDADAVKAYSIHYARSDAGDGTEELQQVTANTSMALHNLKASTTYSFYVRAYTQSASDPSRRLLFTTPDAHSSDAHSSDVDPDPDPVISAPSLAPNVTLLPLSPTSLKVTWPPASAGVALYKIQYRRHQSNEFDIEVVRGFYFDFFKNSFFDFFFVYLKTILLTLFIECY